MARHLFILFSVLLASITAASSAAAEKRVALVVGINSYDNLDGDKQLKKARSDADALARTFKDLGFDVIARDDLTRPAFNTAWTDFLSKLEPGDTAAFYFAGHGVELGGRNYLLPKDVPSIKPGRDELLKRESLSLQEFLEDLRERGTRLNLVILDACRDNPFPQLAGRSVGRARGLAVTEPPEGTFIMYSAGTGESALDRLNDDDQDPNSVFTRQLLPLLRTRGLSLTDVAEEIRLGVRKLALTADNHRQTPAYYNQVLGRVCLAGCAEVRPVPRFRIVSSTLDWGWASVRIEIQKTPDPAKAMRVQVNGRLIEERTPRFGEVEIDRGEPVLRVPLFRGRNVVRIILTNDIGEKAETVTLDFDGEGELDKGGTLYMLAIGVDSYPGLGKTCGATGDFSCDLKFAGADARRLADTVERRMGPSHTKVVKRLLVNGVGAADDPTVSNILDALDLFKQAKANDTIVFFVSGHSSLTEEKNFRFLSTTAERLGDSFRGATVVPWQALQEAIESAKGRRILFVDTAISGNAFNLRPGNSVVTYTAAAWNQEAMEDYSIGHGLFTYAVVDGLEGQAVDGDRKQITTKSLADYIGRRVDELAKALKGEQEPQYFSGGDADEDHVLVNWTWEIPPKKLIPVLPSVHKR